MHFGRRVTAFCAAVVVFTLETHDSSLGGPMSHHRAQADCDGCQTGHTKSKPRVANTRVPYRVAYDDWHLHHTSGSDDVGAAPHGGPETPRADDSHGWAQFAAGGPDFSGGAGNGGNSGGHPGSDTGSGGGANGDGPGTPPDIPPAGGGGGPPVVIIDPPDGPVTPIDPPGGNGNTPGTTDVPEPGTLLIALAGLAGLVRIRRRQRAG